MASRRLDEGQDRSIAAIEALEEGRIADAARMIGPDDRGEVSSRVFRTLQLQWYEFMSQESEALKVAGDGPSLWLLYRTAQRILPRYEERFGTLARTVGRPLAEQYDRSGKAARARGDIAGAYAYSVVARAMGEPDPSRDAEVAGLRNLARERHLPRLSVVVATSPPPTEAKGRELASQIDQTLRALLPELRVGGTCSGDGPSCAQLRIEVLPSKPVEGAPPPIAGAPYRYAGLTLTDAVNGNRGMLSRSRVEASVETPPGSSTRALVAEIGARVRALLEGEGAWDPSGGVETLESVVVEMASAAPPDASSRETAAVERLIPLLP